MRPIILIDHEDEWLFIAEITKDSDIKKIEKENEKLNSEFREDSYKWDMDYYVELENRTWVNIYKADFLYV